jgi:hypothetical protein
VSRLSGRRPIDAALIYARRSWEVFPCHSPARTPGSCTCHHTDCNSPAKHPRVSGGLNSATRDEGLIRRWWASWPHANVAIRTGAASGIVVVDVDPDHGGDDSLRAVLAAHEPLPPGRTIRTGSGGLHLYFAHPGETVRNDAGRRLGPGLDIRGDGGYVIAPPSVHASGARYAVAGRGGDIPEMPGWLLDLLRKEEPAPRAAPSARAVEHGDAWARAAADGELQELRHATAGIRNSTLNRVSFKLGQIIGAGLLEQSEIEQSLVDAGLAVGLGEREAIRTVRSGLSAGIELPRGPSEPRIEADLDVPGPSLP